MSPIIVGPATVNDEMIHPHFVKFIDEYLLDKELNEAVKRIFKANWKKLREMPASSSGRYHHVAENYIPYGLINHIMRVVYFCNDLVTEEQGYDKDPPERMKVVAAAFLHDLGKMDTYKSDHGRFSKKYLSEEKAITEDILKMCERHMHFWGYNRAQHTLEIIVAYGDYIASRENVEIVGFTYITTDGGTEVPVRRVRMTGPDGTPVI
jgi:hypothetical protein